MPVQKKHFYYIDVLRVLASIMVIITHVVMHNIYIYKAHSASWNILVLAKIITQFAVPCFFMISGAMIISNPHDASYRVFLKNRFIKILIPFLVWSFIYYLFFSFCLHQYEFSLYDFIKRLFAQDISGHFWYMYALVLLYTLLPFLKQMLRSMKEKEVLLLMSVLCLFGSVLPLFAELIEVSIGFNVSLFCISKVGVYINYMIAGYYIHNLEKSELKVKTKFLAAFSVIMIAFLFVTTYIFSENSINQTWINIVWMPVFIISITVFSLAKLLIDERPIDVMKGAHKLIFNLSKLSFTAYLLHMLIIRTFQYYCPNDLLREVMKSGYRYETQIITLIEGILAVILSYCFAFLCKKIKYINKYI